MQVAALTGGRGAFEFAGDDRAAGSAAVEFDDGVEDGLGC